MTFTLDPWRIPIKASASISSAMNSLYGLLAAGALGLPIGSALASGGEESSKSALVPAVWVAGKGDTAKGGVSLVRVEVTNNFDGMAPVSLGGDFVESLGATWRATAWMAAFCASHLNGNLIVDKHFLIRVGGHIDGPSAGALLTSTILAQLQPLPAPIKENVTITGTINPDGTIGAVGGVPEKIIAAGKAGITAFGYPSGNRFYTLPGSDEVLDLELTHSKYGVRLVKVSDVYEAFELLTGTALARPEAVGENRMSLTTDLTARLTAIRSKLHQEAEDRLESAKTELDGLGQELADQIAEVLKNETNGLLENAIEELGRSLSNAKGGNVPEAFLDAQEAHSMAHEYASLLHVLIPIFLNGYTETGITEATKRLEQLREEAVQLTQQMKTLARAAYERSHVGNKLDGLNAVLQYWAVESMRRSTSEKDESLARLIKDLGNLEEGSEEAEKHGAKYGATLFSVSRGWAATSSRAIAGIAGIERLPSGPLGKPVSIRSGFVPALAKAYSAAAVASFNYFTSIWQGANAAKQEMSIRLHSEEPKVEDSLYTTVKAAAHAAEYSFEDFLINSDDSTKGNAAANSEAALDLLGSSMYAYVGASDLIYRYLLFPLIKNSRGELTISNPFSLKESIRTAERAIREKSSALLKEKDFVPDSIALNYQLASSLVLNDSPAEKLAALRFYGRSYFLCSFYENLLYFTKD